ncbi:DUF2909 domain-containing protein [Saccharobesus litoralis]|uniref:DUF2909 domain-containing protein n=1 Tax=Saccharobesus litoralis TaxID=2172099 RepID=A0A2S0VRH7_9ALTE|nr:DUF2909 domain-containing protein [Saccharobesus litoralis]AWB66690.1 DUF2909 domain-containing protein [Saccharobesus litoralis]
MLIKLVIVIALLFVLYNLFRAMMIMVRNEKEVAMSHYLGKRLLFSAAIILLIILSAALGLIQINPTPY